MVGRVRDPSSDSLELRAAADRLLAGTQLHSSGKLTILDLAEEAQVKRWLPRRKYPTTLMAKYQAEFKAARHKSEPVKKAEAESDKLHEELDRVRMEKRRLSELVGTYAGRDRAAGEGAGRGHRRTRCGPRREGRRAGRHSWSATSQQGPLRTGGIGGSHGES